MSGENGDLSIKRRALLGAVATGTGTLSGCSELSVPDWCTNYPSTRIPCSLSWRPSALAPVRPGWRDYGKEDGAPGSIRVFYPSVEHPHPGSEILKGCGNYPLVLFVHGQCDEPEHHEDWLLLPATIARAGYVVGVPDVPQRVIPRKNTEGLDRLGEIFDWLRKSWEHCDVLWPTTGVAGHSFGAVLAARFGVDNDVSAYASIDGRWDEGMETLERIKGLEEPKFFCWAGTGTVAPPDVFDWESLASPKHKAVFENEYHWDFLQDPSCGETFGPCSLTSSLTSDLTVMFFGKYLGTRSRFRGIPATLIPPPLDLTPKQEKMAYWGDYLSSFSRLGSDCKLTLTWDGYRKSGTKTLPD